MDLDHLERARRQRQARLIEVTRGTEIALTSQQPCSSGGQFRIAPFDALKKNTTVSNSKTIGLSSLAIRISTITLNLNRSGSFRA